MESFVLGTIFFGIPLGVLVFLYVMMCNETPLFKMKCKNCGKKDRNWSVMPIGYDNFAWQHNCEK